MTIYRATSVLDQFAKIGARFILADALALMLTMQAYGDVVPPPVRACRSMPDEAQRLRCYDSAVDAAGKPMPAHESSTRSESAVRPAGESLAQAVAPPAAVAAPPAVPPNAAAAPARQIMFSATVSALTFRQSGAVNVTLDNGQVWTQYGPEGRVPLRVGDAVIIRPSLFGASVLVGPTGWITKVHPMEHSTSKP